jgi:hypothetical protein
MRHSLAVTSLLAIFLTACSGPEPVEKKAAVKPAEPVTGQSALWKMYQTARSWAPDAQILKMNSIAITEVKSTPGKSGAWQAFFTSADKGRLRSYTYSVVEAEGNIHEGVFPGAEEPWSGPRESPFVIAGVKVDTDAALKTAEGKTAAYKLQTKDKPISFLLERAKKFPNPAWRVIWGESVGTAALSVYIDAVTGEYLETMH